MGRNGQYTVEGVSSAECPVSVATEVMPQAQQLVQIFERSKRLASLNAPLYGPHLESWPVLIVDAFDVLECETIAIDNARIRNQ